MLRREAVIQQAEAHKRNKVLHSASLSDSSSSSTMSSGSSSSSSSQSHRAQVKRRKMSSNPQGQHHPILPCLGSTETRNDRWFASSSSIDRSIDTVLRRADILSKTDVCCKLTGADRCSVCMEEFLTRADHDDQAPHSDSDKLVLASEDAIVRLQHCVGHYFHRDCIRGSLGYSARCPNCLIVYGDLKGTQPEGSMSVSLLPHSSAPISGLSCDTICITYSFPSGIQGEEHPNPRHPYTGTSRGAYLPDNREGHKVLALLQKAWDARLIFRVGTSVTTGCENTVVWNGIHHKTSLSGGSSCFGYPDPTYLTRVTEELAAVGII
jgi:deltex-like protein